jgi:ferredoxin
VKVEFETARGETVTAEAQPGDNMLRVAQAAGLPLVGTCEGQMACSPCHVIVADEWFARLDAASEEEEDMLDLAAGVARTSRRACQIDLAPDLDGLKVRLPAESYDMSR